MEIDNTLANELTRALTAFVSFAEFVRCAYKHNYTPTLRGWNKETQKQADQLADLFDRAMAEKGSSIRAWPKRENLPSGVPGYKISGFFDE